MIRQSNYFIWITKIIKIDRWKPIHKINCYDFTKIQSAKLYNFLIHNILLKSSVVIAVELYIIYYHEVQIYEPKASLLILQAVNCSSTCNEIRFWNLIREHNKKS